MEIKKHPLLDKSPNRPAVFLIALFLALIWQFMPYHISLQLPESQRNLASTDLPTISLTWPSLASLNTVQATGGLTITKMAHPTIPPIVNQGGLITYTLILTNHTGSHLDNLLITDTVPGNTQCDTVFSPADWFSNGSNCDQATQIFWASQSNILTNATSLRLDYSVQVAKPLLYQTTIINDDYRVSAKGVGGGSSYNDIGTATVSIPINSPNWVIAKQVQPPSTVQAGENLNFTITVTNTGSLKTTGAFTISELLPSNTTLATNPDGATVNGGALTWGLSGIELEPNESTSVHFSVLVNSPLSPGTQISNSSYQVEGGEAVGPVLGNPVSVNVTAAEQLTLAKSADKSITFPGEAIAYTLTYQNQGNAVSGNFIISDTIPAGTTYLSSTPFDAFDGNRTYQWTGDNLSPLDGIQTITITLQADAGLNNGTLLTNQATISSTAGSLAMASHVVTVDSRPDLVISQGLAVTQSPIRAGDWLTYTIAYTNVGRTALDSIRITNTLPVSLTLLNAVPDSASQVQADPLVFSQANLGVQENGQIIIVAKVNETPWPATGFDFSNIVVATGSPPESDTTNNQASLTTRGWPGLPSQITTTTATQFPAGANHTLTFKISDQFNNAVADGTVVTFTIDAPATLNPLTSTTSQGQVSTVVQADTATTIQVTVKSGDVEQIFLLDFVGPQLTAHLSGSPKPVFPGGSLNYTIDVTNTGVFTAYGVVITGMLPAELSFVSANLPVTGQSGTDYVFALGDMPPGAVRTLLLTAMAAPNLSESQTILNTSQVDAHALPTPISLADSTSVTVPTLNKFASPNPVLAGESITYTLRYRNDSGGPIANLRITDTLPSQIAAIEMIEAGSAAVINGQLPQLIFNQASVAAGEVITISVVGRVVTGPWSSALTPISNQVSAAYSGQAQTDNLIITSYGRPNRADSLDLTASATLVSVGDQLLLTATSKDVYGNFVADNTAVTFQTDFSDSDIATSGYTKNGLVTATVTTALSQTGTITATIADVVSTLDTTFAQPNLTVSKVSNPAHVAAGGMLVYQLTIVNTGLVAVSQIEVTDHLESNLSLVSTSHVATQNGSDYHFTIPMLAPSQQETIVLTTTTGATLANNTLITNTITITAAHLAEPLQASTVSQISNILVDVDISPSQVRAGELITTTIRHRNDSSQIINSLWLTSTLPAQVEQVTSLDSGSATVIAGTPPTLIFSRSNVSAGQMTVITITGRVITAPWSAALTPLTYETMALAHLADSAEVNLTASAQNMAGPNLSATILLDYLPTAMVSQTIPVTVTVQDQYGNPVLDGTALAITGSANSIIGGATSTSNGQAIATVQTTVAGSTSLTVTVNGLSTQATVSFTAANQQFYLPVVSK